MALRIPETYVRYQIRGFQQNQFLSKIAPKVGCAFILYNGQIILLRGY